MLNPTIDFARRFISSRKQASGNYQQIKGVEPMAIYLDTAIVAQAKAASKFGWIAGITTNPTLLGKSELSPEVTLKQLAQLIPGEVYYQLMASDFDDMVAEGKAAFGLIGKQTVLKVPATATGFQVVAHLSPEIPCAVTAIYSAAQAVVAAEAGAKYAIAYLILPTDESGGFLIKTTKGLSKALTKHLY